MIGENLGHYHVEGRLGGGGMGEVYLARDTRLDRRVALKVLPEAMAADPDLRARFEREARAVAALSHPNIVTIHSVEEAGGVHFLTMELVEGRTLTEVIPDGGFDLEGFLRLALPLADAVAAAHAQGIVHRDLKPDNVMVSASGVVKVLDFGLAKQAAPEGVTPLAVMRTVTGTGEGIIVGTVSYMSPEQAEGKPADVRSDVFALGIVLYEMATGRRPFAGDSAVSVLSSILKDAPPGLAELRPDLPRSLAALVQRCLEKDPDRRFSSAAEVRDELERLREAVGRRNLRSWRARRRAAIVAGIGGAALVAALAALGVVRQWGSRQTSIAVLPFENLSPEPENQYFTDGVTEEITAKLARIGRLKVVARAATARYRGARKDPREIGRELGVDYLLDGSVRKAGERVRIAVQLVGVRDGFQLWSEAFEGGLGDVFRLQEDTALEIAEALEVRLSPGEEQAVRRRLTANPQAFDAYLRGRALLEYFDDASKLELARAHLERALALDPDYPLALAGLSRVEAQYHRNLDPDPARLRRAEELARRALELRPDLAEAHLAMAQVLGNRFEYADAAARCREAIRLDGANAYAWDLLSWALAYQQPPDARGAEDAARRAISLQASLIGAHYHLGRALLLQGRYAEAIEAFAQSRQLDSGFETAHVGMAQAYLAQGDPRRAADALARVTKTAGAPVVLMLGAAIQASLGDREGAFAGLERALAAGYRDAVALRTNPHLASLRGDPRWEPLLRAHGLE